MSVFLRSLFSVLLIGSFVSEEVFPMEQQKNISGKVQRLTLKQGENILQLPAIKAIIDKMQPGGANSNDCLFFFDFDENLKTATTDDRYVPRGESMFIPNKTEKNMKEVLQKLNDLQVPWAILTFRGPGNLSLAKNFVQTVINAYADFYKFTTNNALQKISVDCALNQDCMSAGFDGFGLCAEQAINNINSQISGFMNELIKNDSFLKYGLKDELPNGCYQEKRYLIYKNLIAMNRQNKWIGINEVLEKLAVNNKLPKNVVFCDDMDIFVEDVAESAESGVLKKWKDKGVNFIIVHYPNPISVPDNTSVIDVVKEIQGSNRYVVKKNCKDFKMPEYEKLINNGFYSFQDDQARQKYGISEIQQQQYQQMKQQQQQPKQQYQQVQPQQQQYPQPQVYQQPQQQQPQQQYQQVQQQQQQYPQPQVYQQPQQQYTNQQYQQQQPGYQQPQQQYRQPQQQYQQQQQQYTNQQYQQQQPGYQQPPAYQQPQQSLNIVFSMLNAQLLSYGNYNKDGFEQLASIIAKKIGFVSGQSFHITDFINLMTSKIPSLQFSQQEKIDFINAWVLINNGYYSNCEKIKASKPYNSCKGPIGMLVAIRTLLSLANYSMVLVNWPWSNTLGYNTKSYLDPCSKLTSAIMNLVTSLQNQPNTPSPDELIKNLDLQQFLQQYQQDLDKIPTVRQTLTLSDSKLEKQLAEYGNNELDGINVIADLIREIIIKNNLKIDNLSFENMSEQIIKAILSNIWTEDEKQRLETAMTGILKGYLEQCRKQKKVHMASCTGSIGVLICIKVLQKIGKNFNHILVNTPFETTITKNKQNLIAICSDFVKKLASIVQKK